MLEASGVPRAPIGVHFGTLRGASEAKTAGIRAALAARSSIDP